MGRTLFMVGRAIFGGFFAYSGLNHFRQAEQMSAYAASKGTPAPEAAVAASGAMMLAGGIAVATGMKPRHGLALIALCMLPVTLQMHNYWTVEDAAQRQGELVNFLKNLALIGAALAMMEIDEPWRGSVASGRHAGEEHLPGHVSYPRISMRELPSLPA